MGRKLTDERLARFVMFTDSPL